MDGISDEAIRNRGELARIKRNYASGFISRDEAKRLSTPVIQRINSRAAKIAKKNGKKPRPIIDFVSAMRNDYSDIPYSNRFVVDEDDLKIDKKSEKQ